MDDERIVELFFERSEQAIAELSAKYGGVLQRIALNALGRSADAEECVNDAYLALWNAIPPARPKPLLAFAARIVRNKAVDRFRSRAFRQSGCTECFEELENWLGGGESPEDAIGERELSRLIDEFLRALPELDRMLFVRRYFYMDSCRDLAKTAGLSHGAVRTRLSRIRAGLRAYLTEMGVEI